MESAEFVRDDNEVAAVLQGAIGLLVRKMRQAHLPGELTLAESSALNRLGKGGPATSSDLAKQDRISPQSMGATLAALEQRGLIERHRDPADGRRIMLSVSDAGRQMISDRRGARAGQLAAALRAAFTDGEVSQLRAAAPLLERLAEKL